MISTAPRKDFCKPDCVCARQGEVHCVKVLPEVNAWWRSRERAVASRIMDIDIFDEADTVCAINELWQLATVGRDISPDDGTPLQQMIKLWEGIEVLHNVGVDNCNKETSLRHLSAEKKRRAGLVTDALKLYQKTLGWDDGET